MRWRRASLPFPLQLVAEAGDFGFEDEDPADAGEGHALAGHLGHPLDPADLGSAVAALAPVRARRLHDALAVEPAEKRGLHAEDLSDLADGVQRRMLVLKQ